MTKKKNGFAGTTHVFFVLDRSGSMNAVRQATISGFNEWLHGVQRDDANALFTLSLFNTKVDVPVTAEPINDVADLDETRYVPDGMTALYDALAQAVRSGERAMSDKDRALVVVMTDGQENSSREITREALAKLVTEREGKGNWTFTYLSAGPDAFADSAAIGMRRGNTQSYTATSQGTQSALRSVSAATENYLSGAAPQSTAFYERGKREDDKTPKRTRWVVREGKQ